MLMRIFTGMAVTILGVCALPSTAAAKEWKGEGWEFKLAGRLQADYVIADADTANADFNGSELRRARLGVKGRIGSNLEYKLEFNTNSSNDVTTTDAWLQWQPDSNSNWKVKLGQFKTPNSLDEQTSSRFISVHERSAFTDAFQFNRRLGIGVSTRGDNFTFAAGVFGDNLEVSSREEGVAVAARATVTPVAEKEKIVHLGTSFRWRETGDTQSDLRYRQRPVTHIPGRILSTGRISDSDTFYGVEAATVFKGAWAAAEYGISSADCSSTALTSGACTSDPDFDGGYLEAGTFIGGARTYKGGKFDRPKVNNPVTKNGRGALSLVARYDTISLSDAGVNGGEYDSVVLGADWWPTRYTRIGVNIFNVDADLGTSTSGLDPSFAGLVTAGVSNEDVSGASFRVQFDF